MKFTTLPDGTKDGRLFIVSRDMTRIEPAKGAHTMQELMERWDEVEIQLEMEYEAVNNGLGGGFNPAAALAPLPRAWQWLDGSAYDSHGDLMSKVFGMEDQSKPPFPYMYQGVSSKFYGPTEDVKFATEDDFIDFEGEFGIITDKVPLGTSAEAARTHIRLIVQINDWSLRRIAPIEMKAGFGWVLAKPPCAVAPVAVTPDELGAAWRDARVDLALNVWWNGEKFGSANGYAMSVGFDELVAHAAYSRDLVAGTVIGSGTVSNETYRDVGSSCIAERRGIEMIDEGEAKTGFMRFGDRVKMEVFDADGQSVFGAIDQQVVQA
ncbi:fumarylacetoacetate hydrolase family protein [Maritimibacter sp. UBA3975]|uniref:fumarylacetoacetate hydrolase family protein n=1 Tax=Maritimibacter sp. UBA3975 TaxID=1946833 RepID=UPI000C0A297C|nr:fumarylacetoacetate hydrolase family protein [Maritimibacter sp. UBA3975]MAM60777.1 fumarylacetoacetate hydrolase [Maritimibacter sp.]|tara:strand:+ start:39472 stop:40437 length:966 start_codon:yes stop_codon:yes gene_type:complete